MVTTGFRVLPIRKRTTNTTLTDSTTVLVAEFPNLSLIDV